MTAMYKTHAQATDAIATLETSDTLISLMSNPMLGSGRVYLAKVVDGEAIVTDKARHWIGMNFFSFVPGDEHTKGTLATHKVGDSLGPITVIRQSGSLKFTLQAGGYVEGRG